MITELNSVKCCAYCQRSMMSAATVLCNVATTVANTRDQQQHVADCDNYTLWLSHVWHFYTIVQLSHVQRHYILILHV